MNHRERIQAAISGKPVDRPPVALWRHFPVDDQAAETLAAAHIAWQQQWDWDLLKVTPSSGYFLYDWGLQDRWTGGTEGTRDYTKRVGSGPEQWGQLPPLDFAKGHLGLQHAALQQITRALGPDVPVIMTIFSPLSNAKKLAGDELMLEHLSQHPAELKRGLEQLAGETLGFIRSLKDTGIAGIFYAVQHASADLLTPDEYREFGRPHDLQITEAAAELYWFNLLHLHGQNILFDSFTDFPVQAVNWHDRETPPTLAEGKTRFPGAVCGGLRQWESLVLGTPEQVQAEAKDAIQSTGGQRFILGTGCVTITHSPYGNIAAVRAAVE